MEEVVRSEEDRGDKALRVLILAPHGRDSALARETLARNGFACCVCADVRQLRIESAGGAGCLLIAEEALTSIPADDCSRLVGPEPSWSSLPIVVLLGRGSSFHTLPLLRKLERRPNVGFLRRPVPRRALISAIDAALEARRLQFNIRDALEKLEVATRRKDEFIATLSHELRNPLAPIRNAIPVLRNLLDDPDSKEKASKLLSMVERQTDHLVQLVDDLLEVSRITTGKVRLNRRNTNLQEIIRQAIEISEPLMTEARHRLDVSLCDELLFVNGDGIRLAQVFSNLLNNSARYTPPGGRVAVSLTREGTKAIVRVADNGIGISEKMLPRVFDLFSQSRAAKSGGKGGLGVGLALVKELVELHGGAVVARSDGAGRGSEFVVSLPLAAACDLAGVSDRGSLAPDLSRRRILVVDDERDVADSLAMLLHAFGADVRVAYSGADALACVDAFAPQLAILDIGMPGMDGYETARRLLSTNGGANIRLVALSGWGQEDDRRLAMEAGFARHLTKPVQMSDLLEIVASPSSPDPGVSVRTPGVSS